MKINTTEEKRIKELYNYYIANCKRFKRDYISLEQYAKEIKEVWKENEKPERKEHLKQISRAIKECNEVLK
jgi:preprotein translocase subunit Sss1